MSPRVSIFLAIFLLLPSLAVAKKKKQALPDFVLDAHTVLVVIHPDAGEPISNPTANRIAQENVEKALMKWGRLSLVMSAQTADLIIAVRKGHANGPAIRNSPTDQRPVVLEPSDGEIRVGAQRGQPPGLGPGRSEGPGPSLGNEIGPSQDSFEVYRGGIEDPLDAPPVWRYMARNALDQPTVDAVAQFRKAVDDSQKQHQQKP
jgi:hypothetical protein